jgi:hypothetical protein
MKRLIQKSQGGATRGASFWRRAAPARPRRNRLLRTERLEDRQLLAGDFHNAAFPADVNDDGRATVADLLTVLTALRDGGPRILSTAGLGEGESPAPSAYVDVNGDNRLSIVDALNVVYELRGEGEAIARDDTFNPNDPNDPFTVTSNSTDNVLPVLANDSPAGALTILRVGTLQSGPTGSTTSTEFGGTATIQGGGLNTTIVYTPAVDFYGQDRFVYEVLDVNESDPDRQQDTAVVTVFVEPGPGDVFVRFTYQLFSSGGQPITQVEEGQTFQIRAFVQDTRSVDPRPSTPQDDRGVAAAALDVDFQPNLLTVQNVVFGPNYQLLTSVDTSSNNPEINEASAAQTDLTSQDPLPQPLGPNPVLFFTATVTANAQGTVMVLGDPADQPENQIVFLEPGQLDAVPPSAVDYGSLTFQVTAPIGAVSDAFVRNEDLTPGADPQLSSPTLNVLANDTNIDGTTPFVGNIIGLGPTNATQITLPSGSTISITPGGQSLTYSPALNFFGAEAPFTYTIRDLTNQTDTATVNITVNPINDRPNAVDDNFGPFIENSGQTTLDVLANDFDVDGDPLTIIGLGPNNQQTLNLPTGGVVSIAPNGQTLLYTPGSVPGESFTYTISDGQLTDTATVTTTIQRFDQSVEIGVRLTDLNGNPLPTVGGTPQLNVGQQFRVVVSVQDLRPASETQLGLGVFSAFIDLLYSAQNFAFVGPVTFGPEYNNPSFRRPGDASVDGIIDEVGSPQTDLLSGPIGAGPFTLFSTIFVAEQFGTATITADPPDVAGNEIQLFDPPTIVAPDDVRFGTVTVNIVNPSGQMPTAIDDLYTVPGGQTFQVSNRAQGVLGNDIDPEGDNTIQAVLTAAPNNGMLTLNANGTFTYTPNAGFIGTDTFRYRATDGGPLSNEALVTLNVIASVNDDTFFGNVNQIVTGNVLANDAVPPGTTVTLVTAPTRAAAFTLNPNGTFSYTPELNQSYTDTFVYAAAGQTATVIIRIGSPAAAVSGFAYTDENASRVMEPGERRLGGVTIQLRNNTTGQVLTTKTSSSGAYAFANVTPGSYTLTGVQPSFMIDGWNSINGQTVTGDSIVINVNGTSHRVDFGERGLRAEFVTPRDFFGQADANGFQIALNAGAQLGSEHWFSFLDGWSNFTRVTASVTTDGTRATIRATRNDGATFTLSNYVLDSSIRLMGRIGNGVVLRFEGTPAQFIAKGAVQGAEGEGEADSYEGAVDQLFAQGWSD